MCIYLHRIDWFLSAPATLLDMKAFQYVVSYHGKDSLSLPLDWKQAPFSDYIFIIVSSGACNFAENKQRVEKKEASTVKMFNEIIRYYYFFSPSYILQTAMKILSAKCFHLQILICMKL